jgi:hypothetical protein
VQANDKLLGKMARLCGEIPPSWKGYWESREKLRNMSTFWGFPLLSIFSLTDFLAQLSLMRSESPMGTGNLDLNTILVKKNTRIRKRDPRRPIFRVPSFHVQDRSWMSWSAKRRRSIGASVVCSCESGKLGSNCQTANIASWSSKRLSVSASSPTKLGKSHEV